jgi:hypothetical protein
MAYRTMTFCERDKQSILQLQLGAVYIIEDTVCVPSAKLHIAIRPDDCSLLYHNHFWQ